MRRHVSAAIFVLATAFAAVNAQQGPAAPQVPSVSKRPNGGGLATIRMGAPDNNMWFGWRVAAPDGVAEGHDVLRRARQGGCVARRKRRSVEHADHQLRSAEAARSAAAGERARGRRVSPARDRRVDRGVSRRQHRRRRRGAPARVRVRQGDQRAAHHHQRGCGESGRARQAGRGVRHQRRAREQGRSEDRDGGARRARQAHGRERASRRLGAGRRQGGRRPGDRQGQAAARHRGRPQRAERACARRGAWRRRRGHRRLLSRGLQGGPQAAVDYGRVDRARPKPTW